MLPKGGVVRRAEEVGKAGDTRLCLPSFIDKGHEALYIHAQTKRHERKSVSQP
jgi:hypothetical protein